MRLLCKLQREKERFILSVHVEENVFPTWKFTIDKTCQLVLDIPVFAR